MFHELLEAVRGEVSGARALESVRALARFHRVQASPGYDEAARWLCDRVADIGLDVEIERVPGDGHTRLLGQLMPEGWACDHAVATVVEGSMRERICDERAEKLSIILRSDSMRGRFPLVELCDGTHDDHYAGRDVRDHVVVTCGAVQRVHQLAVLERGAAGILYDGRRAIPPVRDRFDDPDALSYTSFWWNGDAPRGWGFVVSPRTGERLRERLRGGATLELEAEIRARRFATEIPLISARLAGESDREVLIVSHLCHPQPSANDNASGVAAALEAARTLMALQAGGAWPQTRDRGAMGGRGRPRHGIRFLWVPEFTGTFAWLAQDPQRATRLIAALNLDMVGEDQGQCGSTLLIEQPPCFSALFAEELLARIRAQAVDWVHSYSGPGHYSMTRMAEVPFGGGSDHAVLVDPMVGVPCPMMIQWPDRFYHSSHDTPDKTDPASLALAARCAATYAGFLADADDEALEWLLQAVGRGARRRWLEALDHPERARALERERWRAASALASLERLGIDGSRTRAEWERLEDDAARWGSRSEGPRPASGGDRPRRRLRAALHHQWHLMPGYGALTRGDREALRGLETSIADADLVFEVAWFACDGRRTLEDIAHVVEVETGHLAPQAIAEFFAWTVRWGLCEWSSGDERVGSIGVRDTAAP